MQKYSVNQHVISSILAWVQSGEIAIPEIQRPFVWNSTKVRDLLDSLYQGYPIGYIIAWKNPDMRLKDGTTASGKKIIIDGQQRITALRAAILGEEIVDDNYRKKRIKIAFHPLERKFETLTPAIQKDGAWISDIAEYMENESGLFALVDEYCEKNQDAGRKEVQESVSRLFEIKSKQIGFIELNEGLDIETVTEIFIRINSKGVVLSQADFAMSKIASHGDFGVNLRKAIDYFCHALRDGQFFQQIKEVDKEFAKTEYLQKINWAQGEDDDLYQPDYNDIIRVSFTKEFNRGKLSDLVSLLSGRNFKTRAFEQSIQEESFEKLKQGVLDFVNKTHFERFTMIIKSTGATCSRLIRSQNAVNFAYVLYLRLRAEGMNDGEIEGYVRRWFVMSMLTGRYSASPESTFDRDIKSINSNGIAQELASIEETDLSDTFWKSGLVRELDKAVVGSPYLSLFWMAQINSNDRGFLSKEITVRDMITHRGDIHHLFPRKYLQQNHLERKEYNQLANFVYTQSEINIRIGHKAPKQYFDEIKGQIETGKLTYGEITSMDDLRKNLKANCVPESVMEMEVDNYQDFLTERRKLMAEKIEKYYKSL